MIEGKTDGHEPITFYPNASNKKDIVLFYAVYLIGLSEISELNDSALQKILKNGFPNTTAGKIIITDEIASQLKYKIMCNRNYTEVLEKGAEKIKRWKN